MKILLVNAIDQRDVTDAPHLGLLYLASYLRKYQPEHDIRITQSNIKKNIHDFQPDVVGITSVSQNFNIAKEVAKTAKDSGAFVIIGGVHITLMPSSLDKHMDAGVISEGEQAFLEFVTAVNGGLTKEKLEQINGIVYWDNEKPKFSSSRALFSNLDELPYPARDLIDYDWTMATMFTLRGCPYNCVFCSSTRIWEKVRYHSPKYVIEEIEYLRNTYGTRHITFNDDLFIANPKRVLEISELIYNSGLNKEMTFTMSCRANLVTEEIAKALKRMGTELVSMGLETGSSAIIKYAKGPAIDMEDNKRAINILKENGIDVHGTFIIGFPIDTKETILETLNFIKNSRLDSFEAYILAPMPGTPIWDYAIGRGLVDNDLDWSKIAHRNEYDFMEKLTLCENVSKEELFELYNMFVKERKKRKLIHIMRNAVRHPYRIPIYFKNRILPKSEPVAKMIEKPKIEA